MTITIESWRNDDLTIWQDTIIPAFEAQHPNIKVVFAPTAPAEYNGVLNTKLEGGTAGDLITCRPFDTSLGLYDQGNLASLNDLPGMDNFSDVAKSAWITDDGSDGFHGNVVQMMQDWRKSNPNAVGGAHVIGGNVDGALFARTVVGGG